MQNSPLTRDEVEDKITVWVELTTTDVLIKIADTAVYLCNDQAITKIGE